MSATKFLDSTGVALLWAKIKAADANKVDKVNGKGLSTEDYTLADATKLANIESGAQVNVLEGIQLAGTDVTVSSKKSNIPAATTSAYGVTQLSDSVSSTSTSLAATANAVKTAYDLANGKQSPATTLAGYGITNAYTKTEVDTAIASAAGGMSFEIVSSLPATGSSNTIYLMAQSGGSGTDLYDEYIWLSSSSAYEKIGSTGVDLTGYWNSTNLVALTSNEIDAICT